MKAAQAVMGIDVGGRRKLHHVAVLVGSDVVHTAAGLDAAAVIAEAADVGARLVAVDAPARPAPDGERSRPDERAFARAGICGIRFTPDSDTMAGNPYYDWVEQGLAVHTALRAAGVAAVECFPTAAWTRWYGPRENRPRGAWSTRALAALIQAGLGGCPQRMGQDQRDAIAAAVLARQALLTPDSIEWFGEIAVPTQFPDFG